MRVLILGGTTEASSLARRLATERPGWLVTVSLAGLTAHPVAMPGTVRSGGFGGPDGLARYLSEPATAVDAVVDATHPFAQQMPRHAALACAEASVARLRLLRAPWTKQRGDDWRAVANVGEAAYKLGEMGARRVFLTSGRKELAPFRSGVSCAGWFLVRTVERPGADELPPGEAIVDRGPFTLEGELELMRRYRIDTLVTKNSGGSAAEAKLHAARDLQIPVVIVDRPQPIAGPTVETVNSAIRWLTDPVSGVPPRREHP